MRSRARTWLTGSLGVVAGAFAAWASIASAAAAPTYAFLGDIAIPTAAVNSSGGKFTTFDNSAFDANTQLDYVADRSNNSVDVFSSATDTFLTRLTGYVGVKSSNALSGPDGIVVINDPGQHVLWAGDGKAATPAARGHGHG